MASKISDSWQTVAKALWGHSVKKRRDSPKILPHLHSTKPPMTNQLTSTTVQHQCWLQGVWGAATKPPIKKSTISNFDISIKLRNINQRTYFVAFNTKQVANRTFQCMQALIITLPFGYY